MNPRQTKWLLWVLNNTPMVLFAAVALSFGLLSPKFLAGANLLNILIQSSATAVVAIGMTFVLLTAGVDLSVGAIMFVTAAVAGKLVLQHDVSMGAAIAIMLGLGLLAGAVNGSLVTRWGLVPFIATLGTLYLGRGLGLWLTQTRAMNLPEGFRELGTTRWAGIPLPVVILGAVLLLAHVALTRTPFGRQIYATGADPEAARKAGVNTRRLLFWVYVICGGTAAVGSVLALAQLGTVSPTFGNQREFAAIAAAVLGGTSLFGGRGQVFPGTVLGAVLIQSIENGLVVLNANPYLYPLVTSGIIFLAVLIDSLRNHLLSHLSRRQIRRESETRPP
jgi:ribose transport system permease protein